MLKYGVNISMIFTEYPLEERIRRTAEAGFKTFEFLFARQFNMDDMFRLRDQYGLDVQLFDPYVPTEGPYERGYLSMPEGEADFFRHLEEAIAVARRLGCKRLNNLVGFSVPGIERQRQRDLIVERLSKAAPMAAGEGITILIEALNAFDFPTYFLHNSKEGFQLVEAVGAPNVKFQYDLYHLQLMEGNLINTIRDNLDKIGHIQIADVPGRHQPGTGEINYPNVLKAIEEAGYDGFIGLEYKPLGLSEESFGWLEDLKR